MGTLIRRNEIAYTALATIVGVLSGLAVVAMQELIHLMGFWIFGTTTEVSGADQINPLRAFGGRFPAASWRG
ncbi:hypothetical protein [Paracoccus rhizosphaerae]